MSHIIGSIGSIICPFDRVNKAKALAAKKIDNTLLSVLMQICYSLPSILNDYPSKMIPETILITHLLY